MNNLQTFCSKIERFVSLYPGLFAVGFALLVALSILSHALRMPTEVRIGLYESLTRQYVLQRNLFNDRMSPADERIRWLEKRVDLLSEIEEQEQRKGCVKWKHVVYVGRDLKHQRGRTY